MDLPADEVRGGTGRSATFVELFFDLVYVFAITQVVGLVHEDPTVGGLAKGALVLMIMWWTWSIYTWTINWTGTASVPIRLFLLAAMGTSMLMATAVPDALSDESALFGATLFVARMLAAALYYTASKDYPIQRAAFFTFFPITFVAALLFLIGGFLTGVWVIALFVVGVVLDVLGAVNAGRGVWAVDASHFAERNGLFVIIALGESIVGVGLAATGNISDLAHILAITVAFAGVAALWWAYFDQAAPYAEERFSQLTGQRRGRFARDVYTLGHYPLVVGIVYFAVGLEEVVSHPLTVMSIVNRFALGSGAALVLLTIALLSWRGKRFLRTEMLVAGLGLLALVWLGSEVSGLDFALLVLAVLVATLVVERTGLRPGERE